MTVSTYLKSLADDAVLRGDEKDSIKTSIDYLSGRLKSYFLDNIESQFIFGSHTRGTILPRFMDEKSDIDYMVVFSDRDYQPQTYLDRLRRFTEYYYQKSEIKQSHPTIQLELNHIRFELVPAVKDWVWGLKIPAKGSGTDWVYTDPNDFNHKLTEKNKINDYRIKPLVRLVKYWNACNGYPFESYDLEQKIVAHTFGFIWQACDLKKYFYGFMEGLSLPWAAPVWKQDKLTRAKDLIASIKVDEQQGRDAAAENKMKRLLPPPVSIKSSLYG